jgi:iron complex outermembrane receptor protein
LPGFHALEFTAAARFEEFRNNDTNVLVPKVGVRWQPLDESLTFRSTWGEGFHEPSLIEFFGSPQQGLLGPGFNDPATVDPDTGKPPGPVAPDVPFIIRSNPNLQPEDSRSFTAGFVYTPKFVQGLTVTVDLFDIESKGRVIIPSTQGVIDRSVAGQSLPLESVNRDANGEIVSIELAYQNAGSQKARGVDFGIQYQIQTQFGVFTSLTQATYLDSFQFAEVPGDTELELRSGTLPGPLSDEGYLKWKANSRLDWAWRGFDFALTVHYLDGFHGKQKFSSDLVIPYPNGFKERYVKETWFFDVQASYNFVFVPPIETAAVPGYSKDAVSPGDGKSTENAAAQTASFGLPCWKRLLNGTTVTLGCNNVFGHDPPDALAPANYPDFIYDSTGRFVYVSLTKKF